MTRDGTTWSVRRQQSIDNVACLLQDRSLACRDEALLLGVDAVRAELDLWDRPADENMGLVAMHTSSGQFRTETLPLWRDCLLLWRTGWDNHCICRLVPAIQAGSRHTNHMLTVAWQHQYEDQGLRAHRPFPMAMPARLMRSSAGLALLVRQTWWLTTGM